MADVGQENSEMPEMMPSSPSSKFSSNSAMVATAWPLTRKKKARPCCLPGLPLPALNTTKYFTLVHNTKTNIPAKIAHVCCGVHKLLVTCNLLVVFIYDF